MSNTTAQFVLNLALIFRPMTGFMMVRFTGFNVRHLFKMTAFDRVLEKQPPVKTALSTSEGVSMAYDGVGAANYAFSHAEHNSTGYCAQYVRRAIEWGGVHVAPTGEAKNYGPSLEAAGFHEVTGAPQRGDVAVIQPITGHPHGHMAIFNGHIWISDFKQKAGPEGFYPGPGYHAAKPRYKIYRHN